MGERVAELGLAAGEVAVHLVEREQHRLGVDVIALREQRRRREAVLVGRLVVGDELLPGRARVVVGDRPGGGGADDIVALFALGAEHGLVDGDRAADQRGLTARLLVLGQEIDAVGAAERDIDRVGVVRDRRDDRREVLVADRHPELLRHMAARLAELGHEAENLGVGEGIILRDRDDLLIMLDVVDVVAEARHPLRAVGGEAEEVGRGIAQGRVLCGRCAVDESDVGLGLRIILDREALVAGERPDEDLDAVLLDQLARGFDCAVGRGVRRSLDDLHLLAARHIVVLFEREFRAAHAVLPKHGEGAFKSGQQPDLDRIVGVGRRDERGAGEQTQREQTVFHILLPPFDPRLIPRNGYNSASGFGAETWARRRHKPSNPSGDTKTMMRKIAPIRVLKRSAPTMSMAKVFNST